MTAPPVEVETEDGTTAAQALGESADGVVTLTEEQLLAAAAAVDAAPLRTLTLADLVSAAQLAWIRCRVEPRREVERWEAVVKAVLSAFGPVNRGEAMPNDEVFALVELG